ncbi:cupin domain-containing protein [Aspergillus lucknowensis]|uniref:Cupin type-2 domain-containing protein n=1 Tax=Aspergillus lucknowensis TaxID=176173 RepID=A0ABR4LPN8_9EURO
MSDQTTTPPLPPTRRIVTSHNPQSQAIIQHDSQIPAQPAGHGIFLTSLWSTPSLPPRTTPDFDSDSNTDMGLAETGLANNGTICRIVDFPPRSTASTAMMHRTMTLDYIYCVKGSVVLVLDDGSRTVLREGDVAVQQATMHAWANEGDEWARLVCVLIAAEPPVVQGKELQTEVPFQL